jgi:hypothetical protein
VLGAIEQLDRTDQRDLVDYCLRTGVDKMHKELLRQDNPFVLAMSALEGLVTAWMQDAEVTCD